MHYYYSYKKKHLGIILNFFFYFGMRSHSLQMWNFSSVNILVEEEKEKRIFKRNHVLTLYMDVSVEKH